ncbi:MAG: methyltransferase, partial [Gammaproteobacteria bacterium]|nr:methyltransferase [Gammaproteobacteria bacterium]
MEISKIEQALKQNRPETDIERDRNRKPADVLHFFGIQEGQKIGEMNSGRGYL